MSKRTRQTEPNRKTRAIVYERDNYRCVMPRCANTFGLGAAHIFVPRSKGGKGVKQNLVLLCQSHHHALDNGRDTEQAKYIQSYCESYLRSHYDFKVSELIIENKWIPKEE